jgi:hypothetical protein
MILIFGSKIWWMGIYKEKASTVLCGGESLGFGAET